MKRVLILIFSLVAVLLGEVHATHNRAGEIIYRRVNSTNSLLYEISIITYTKTGGQSDAADRCELELFFGDGTSEVVQRVNGPVKQSCDPMAMAGEIIVSGTRYNVYTTRHEFPGFGTYTLSVEDPMRNGGVLNIPDSDNVPFYLESELTIDVGTGGNRAPVLQNPPIDNGCVGVPFYHNPGAVDEEGDSLVYSIVPSRSFGGSVISGYRFPDEVSPGPNNNLSIDPRTGTMTWDSPQQAGEYNVAILIEEYRKNGAGQSFRVGSILRDMQIDIGNCPPNNPPLITLNENACITAGDVFVDSVVATDPEGDRLVLSAVGYPLDEGNGGILEPNDSVNGLPPLTLGVSWQTSCEQVRLEPYWLYFKAKELERGAANLVDFKTMGITVVSPALEITSVEPEGTTLKLEWTVAACQQAEGYEIYRFNDSLGYVPNDCVTGVPASLGYELIAEIDDVFTTTYLDDDHGRGLTHGQQYCYMIVTVFADGAQSYPSIEACGMLIRDVPIINKVSVNSTDSVNGSDSIAWFKPVELRTEVFGPPYRYRLSRSEGSNAAFEEVYLSSPSQDPFTLDTTYVDNNLNTRDKQYYYKIEMLSGEAQRSVGDSRPAASIFLRSEPSDNTLTLMWDVDVPWVNDFYAVYRFSNDSASLDSLILLDTVSVPRYIDDSLANLKTYRYMVKAIGRYTAPDLPGELLNNSQIHTGIPVDNEPPCVPPSQFIEGDCDLERTFIAWENPNENCEDVDDVVAYRIYYSPRLGQPLEVLAELTDPNVSSYEHVGDNGSIAGCYAIVAVDSFANESEMNQPLCVDNCPLYELPNVFTPGSDNVNDLFMPFPYKFVESIDISVFNRWGIEVFHTTDPDIRWNGTDMNTGKRLPSGVYYYVCQVNEIRLTGIESRELKGYVHLISEGENTGLAP